MNEQVLAWIILAVFFSFVGVPGVLSFLGIDDTYWKMWLAGHVFIAALLAFLASVIAVYWALITVLT